MRLNLLRRIRRKRITLQSHNARKKSFAMDGKENAQFLALQKLVSSGVMDDTATTLQSLTQKVLE